MFPEQSSPNIESTQLTPASSQPSTQTSPIINPPTIDPVPLIIPKHGNNKRIFWYVMVLIILMSSFCIGAAIVYFSPGFSKIDNKQPNTIVESTNNPLLQMEPTISSSQTVDHIQNFTLLISGEITRKGENYEVNYLSFLPVINPVVSMDAVNNLNSHSILLIENVSKSGITSKYPTSITYCPSYTDVCKAIDALDELETGETVSFGPVAIQIDENTKGLLIKSGDVLLHQLDRPNSKPNIASVYESPARVNINGKETQGKNLVWETTASNEKLYWDLEYQASPDKWASLSFSQMESNREEMFIRPEDILTTLDEIIFRIIVTDGFHVVSANYASTLSTKKDISLKIMGLYGNSYGLGQNANIDIQFIDPETGTGCDGQGCTFGENEGKYAVEWKSSMQNICADDFHSGTLQYKFKKPGEHKISASVRHTESPELQGYAEVIVNVSDSQDYIVTNSGCSY